MISPFYNEPARRSPFSGTLESLPGQLLLLSGGRMAAFTMRLSLRIVLSTPFVVSWTSGRAAMALALSPQRYLNVLMLGWEDVWERCGWRIVILAIPRVCNVIHILSLG
jgi:hypothetical protein